MSSCDHGLAKDFLLAVQVLPQARLQRLGDAGAIAAGQRIDEAAIVSAIASSADTPLGSTATSRRAQQHSKLSVILTATRHAFPTPL